jgi:hypothetical protein
MISKILKEEGCGAGGSTSTILVVRVVTVAGVVRPK